MIGFHIIIYSITNNIITFIIIIIITTKGYTMLDATLNCYLRPDRFDELPFYPSLKKAGAEAFLVSIMKGTLKDIPGMEVIRSLASFR